VSTLREHTQTPQSCWFAVWEGFADLGVRDPRAPKLSLPGREYYLLEGSIDEALVTLSDVEWIYRSPNLWWPEDRAWCVATEIDFAWTYIGGSALHRAIASRSGARGASHDINAGQLHGEVIVSHCASRQRRAILAASPVENETAFRPVRVSAQQVSSMM
jgi:hypothetical protein